MVGRFRDKLLIRPLKDRVDRTGAALFYELDEILHPEKLFIANHRRHDSPLIVRPEVAYLSRAGAQGLDGHLDADLEFTALTHHAHERTAIFHEPYRTRHRRCLLDEIGELHFQVGTLGLKRPFDVIEDVLKVL